MHSPAVSCTCCASTSTSPAASSTSRVPGSGSVRVLLAGADRAPAVRFGVEAEDLPARLRPHREADQVWPRAAYNHLRVSTRRLVLDLGTSGRSQATRRFCATASK